MTYVVGFAFNTDYTDVLLIRKNKPKWQKGLLNGVGGKIEVGEKPLEAMIREFQEETGLYVEHWLSFVYYTDSQTTVHFFFCAIKPELLVQAISFINNTNEALFVVSVNSIPRCDTIPNLAWLIPLAKDHMITKTRPILVQGLPHDIQGGK